MKQGKDIKDLAIELKRRAAVKHDFVADARQLVMTHDSRLGIVGSADHAYLALEATDLAHRQVAEWADIPVSYYKKMWVETPELLATNVNHWFNHPKQETRRMVRTLDGRVRAFLSDRYRRIDNEHIAEAVLPQLLGSDDIKIVSADVTDTRLYIKAVFPRITGEVKRGDIVQSGVLISNSEVGLGPLHVSPLVFRLACTNGLITDASDALGLKKYHIGRKVKSSDEGYEIYTDETLMADDRALMLKLRDTVVAAKSSAVFAKILAKMQEAATGQKIERPMAAVEVMGRTFGLNEGERLSVLETLIRDGDYSRWGAVNAVTEAANNNPEYDRATEFEILGGTILNLGANEWRRIAEAA